MNKVFISHSAEDIWVAQQVAEKLRLQGIQTFIAEKDIQAGGSFDDVIQDTLAKSDAVIFLVTPGSLKSSWLFTEVGAARALGKAIIPVIYGVNLADVPTPLAMYQFVQLEELDRVTGYLKDLGQGATQPRPEKKNSEPKRPQIFLSYAHEDREWLNKVRINLKVLQHEGLKFEIWDDSRIRPGSSWKEEIEQALKSASIGILIVSTDFLASNFVVSNELPELLLKARDDGLVILPLIVRPCRYTRHKTLSLLQAVNDPEKPLVALEDYMQEEILVKLADAVEERITHRS